MKILIGCESSGTIRQAFRAAGHDAWSCDLLPADDNSPYHIQGDVIEAATGQHWDMAIFHPPCTYLTCSAEWAYKERHEIKGKKLSPDKLYGADRKAARDKAAALFMQMVKLPIEKIAIENPVGVMSTRYRKADQYIQPWQFGEDASKNTGLWLKGLPLLNPTKIIAPTVNGKYYSNQTPTGQSKLGPSKDRWKIRSKTYAGIAAAIVDQWGKL